jgi:hypothetical protein
MNIESNELNVPQPNIGDVAHTGATVLLSAIPFLGAGELFKSIIAPPLEKRREKWMETVALRIQELQQKSGITLESLIANEEFQTLLIEATQIAVKTHLDSKRERLSRALKDNVEGKATFDQASFRLRVIDQLLPVHFEIMNNAMRASSFPKVSKKEAIDELGKGLDKNITRPLLRVLVRELENLGLILCKVYRGDDEEGSTYAYEPTYLPF